MSIAGLRADIVTQLKTISSIKRVYDHMPEAINELPCAMVLPKSALYETLGGYACKTMMEVTLLVKRVGDLEEGQADLDAYLDDSTGVDSVCHWVEASTVFNMRVVDFHDYGGLEYPPGGPVFLGVKFLIEAIT